VLLPRSAKEKEENLHRKPARAKGKKRSQVVPPPPFPPARSLKEKKRRAGLRLVLRMKRKGNRDS